MARWMEPTKKQLKEFNAWLAERPPKIRKMVEQYPPWELYRLKDTGHRCRIIGYSPDGTVSVNIPAIYNLITFERNVFGVTLDALKPCELPAPDELVGEILDDDEKLIHINAFRIRNGIPPAKSLDELRGVDGCAVHEHDLKESKKPH
jgi:hypothetical protein